MRITGVEFANIFSWEVNSMFMKGLGVIELVRECGLGLNFQIKRKICYYRENEGKSNQVSFR